MYRAVQYPNEAAIRVFRLPENAGDNDLSLDAKLIIKLDDEITRLKKIIETLGGEWRK
jgi:hypothetical protein